MEIKVNLIVCVDANWGIGKEGELLVDIPEDKHRFRKLTTGGVVLGGRKTMETLPDKKPLPERDNLVLTGKQEYRFGTAGVVHNVQQALEELKQYPTERVFIIGGESVYRTFLPYCDLAFVTKVASCFEADRFFPNLDECSEWELTSQSEEVCYQGMKYRFLEYHRRVSVSDTLHQG